MKIFFMLDPRENRLPRKFPVSSRKMPTVPLVQPEAFVRNNPRIQANLKPFHPINPDKVRADTRARLARQVESLNEHIRSSQQFKGIEFGLHEESGRLFAVVTNQRTGEVLKMIPSEQVLARAATFKNASGLLTDMMG